MSALELIRLAVLAVYLAVFVIVARNTARRPTRASVNATLFFGAIAFALVAGRITQWLGPLPALTIVSSSLALGLPYLLLRLLADYAGVPAWIHRAALAGWLAAAVAIATGGTPLPTVLLLPVVAYFAALALYVAVRFIRASRSGHGVTRRRMSAVGAGIGFLGLAVVDSAVTAFTPPEVDVVIAGLTQVWALASGLCFFIGFTPPRVLRRAWQEPELRAFLRQAAQLPRLPDTESIVAELENGAARSLGARATIGLWDPDGRALVFGAPPDATLTRITGGRFLGWRVFESQRPAYFPDAAAAHPEHADAYRRAGIRTMLIAPITAGDRRLGVLEVYAAREPIFDDDDLALVQLLAEQAAVTLESRALIDEATRVRAQEEATRLKEDFLSAAAHDLKTPLTTLVGQAEYLERKARRDPGAPADAVGLARIVREAKRLSGLVVELLDANRLEQGQLNELEELDLAACAREAAEITDPERVVVQAGAPVVGLYDRQRIGQLFSNLAENALKYSEQGTPVRVLVREEGGQAQISVVDTGIGIPPSDVPYVFERFRRASNVDNRRFTGMGLGLFICKGIVEKHGGRIWVESELGVGTTFHVELPLGGPAPREGTRAV